MGKDPKEPLRKLTRLQIERQLIQLHNQANRIADLMDMHFQRIAELLDSFRALDEKPGATESAVAERARHRATSRPPTQNNQGPKGRK